MIWPLPAPVPPLPAPPLPKPSDPPSNAAGNGGIDAGAFGEKPAGSEMLQPLLICNGVVGGVSLYGVLVLHSGVEASTPFAPSYSEAFSAAYTPA